MTIMVNAVSKQKDNSVKALTRGQQLQSQSRGIFPAE